MTIKPRRPAWLDGWLDYPHGSLSVSKIRELAWYAQGLQDQIAALRAELDIERTAHAETQEELACLRVKAE